MNGDWPEGGGNFFFLFSVSLNPLFSSSLIFEEFCKIRKICDFRVPQSLLGD